MRAIPEPGARIAVIGGGVAGVVTAYLLQAKYEVTLFEAEQRIGGHTNTVEIDSGPDAGLAVDTGFIVLNDRNYPVFTEFLRRLGVAVRWSDMSFSYECRRSGFAYAGTDLGGLFAQRRNAFSPRFYRFLSDIARFSRDGQHLLASEHGAASLSLGEFVTRGRYSQLMREAYLLPMGAAIWSSPLREVLNFPAASFLRFFANHGLLSLRERPRWQTVVGGSHSYLKAFCKTFRGTLRLGAPIERIESDEHAVTIGAANSSPERFEACVICTHADQALRLLGDADPLERELLGAWRYQRNDTYLHTDVSFLPENRRAWASWNACREGESEAPYFTYHMNRLQGFQSTAEYCVTLNPSRPVPDERIVRHFAYEHPVFDSRSVPTQPRLKELQGKRRRYYCGSYFGYGFHEDAVRSAAAIGELFGTPL